MTWLSLCRGRPCVACGADDGTIVPAHANEQRFGKGTGIKADDWTCIPLCATHHSWLDAGKGSRDEKRFMWMKWWTLHMIALAQAELVIPAGQKVRELRPARIPKVLPRNKPDWGPSAA